ncbi:esterase family protein [Corynebacterium testudinoris]|nr:alpha/beta hydrolase family protein [Corynebacterium testudinoris]MBX8995855.1 esterase family protein [Corynebacterium testudinoris]
MTLLSRIAAPLAALSIAATAFTAPVALAAEVTPAQIAGDAHLARIAETAPPVAETDPNWRAKVQQISAENPRVKEVQAYSPSMDRDIPMVVIKAAVHNAPTLYLLNGAGGGEQSNTDWITQTSVVDFYLDKGINVVIPMAGAFSYYTDWVDQDLNTRYLKGPQKWETFLTKELPGPLESYLGANDKRAIAGMSMSATTSLLFAQHNQGFYDAVGSFSGCAATSTPIPWAYLQVTVNRGGATPEQMWGPMGGEYNRYNDALVNADKLRGTELYVSNGSGFAGARDMPGYYIEKGADPLVASIGATRLQVEGGAIEAATNQCTHDLKAKLDRAGIPAHFQFNNVGTHSWSYWEADLENSWPTFARGLGV